jgi:hypothetical protein
MSFTCSGSLEAAARLTAVTLGRYLKQNTGPAISKTKNYQIVTLFH